MKSYLTIDKEAQLGRIKEKYRDKPESEQREKEYFIMNAMSWVLGLLSAITAASFPTLWIYGIVSSWWVAIPIGLMLALAYELFRRDRYDKMFTHYFKNNNNFGLYSSLSLTGLIVAGMISSSIGMWMLIEHFHPSANLISFQEKAANIQSDLDGVQADIKNYKTDPSFKVTDGGKKVLSWTVTNKYLPPLQTRKNELSDQLRAVEAEIEAANGNINENHAETVKQNAWAGSMALLGLEVVLFFVFKGKEKYEYLLLLEDNESNTTLPTIASARGIAEQVKGQIYAQPNAINNFGTQAVNRANIHQPPYSSEGEHVEAPAKKNAPIGFLPKMKCNQAPVEGDSAVQSCTTVYKDLFTVSHISKNSRKEVRYGFDILKSRIKDYEAKRGQYEGPEKRDQYETYDKGLKYWKSKMAELLTLWAENGISQQEAYKDKYQKGLTLI